MDRGACPWDREKSDTAEQLNTIFHCMYMYTQWNIVYIYLLYPFNCPWTFRWLPCLGYYK